MFEHCQDPVYALVGIDLNVIAFTCLNGGTGDIEGKALSYGPTNFGAGFSVADAFNDNTPDPYGYPNDKRLWSLLVVNNLQWTSGTLYPDGSGAAPPLAVLVTGNYTAPEYLLERLVTSRGDQVNCLPGTQTAWQIINNNFPNYVQNAFATRYDEELEITAPADQDFYYLSVSADDWSKKKYFTFYKTQPNLGAQWNIIITGPSAVVIFGGQEFPATYAESVVYSIQNNIGTVRVVNSVAGSIIAPDSDVDQQSGVIEGLVIGKCVNVKQVNQPRCPPYWP